MATTRQGGLMTLVAIPWERAYQNLIGRYVLSFKSFVWDGGAQYST